MSAYRTVGPLVSKMACRYTEGFHGFIVAARSSSGDTLEYFSTRVRKSFTEYELEYTHQELFNFVSSSAEFVKMLTDKIKQTRVLWHGSKNFFLDTEQH